MTKLSSILLVLALSTPAFAATRALPGNGGVRTINPVAARNRAFQPNANGLAENCDDCSQFHSALGRGEAWNQHFVIVAIQPAGREAA